MAFKELSYKDFFKSKNKDTDSAESENKNTGANKTAQAYTTDSRFTASPAVVEDKNKNADVFNTYKNLLNQSVTNTSADKGTVDTTQNDIASQLKSIAEQSGAIASTYQSKLNSSFTPSSAYQQAMAVTNEYLDKLSSGRTSYTDKVEAMINQIQNREKFSYDLTTDPLFQQALASAMKSGKTAMEDTMGQAAALTGGYGSSYAQAVGNQAYNSVIDSAYDKAPDYYNMALNAYNAEGENLYNQLSMLSAEDQAEYERNYNAYTANYNMAQNQYNQEYSQWADEINNALSQANLQLNANSQLYNQLSKYADYVNSQNASDTTEEVALKNPTEKILSELTEIYKNGKYEEYEAALDYYEEQGYNMLGVVSRLENSGYTPSMYNRTYVKVNKNTVRDEFGNEISIDDLPDEIRVKLQKAKNGTTYSYNDEK